MLVYHESISVVFPFVSVLSYNYHQHMNIIVPISSLQLWSSYILTFLHSCFPFVYHFSVAYITVDWPVGHHGPVQSM